MAILKFFFSYLNNKMFLFKIQAFSEFGTRSYICFKVSTVSDNLTFVDILDTFSKYNRKDKIIAENEKFMSFI